MSTPKKRLSGKPVRIDIPNSDRSQIETSLQDSSFKEVSNVDSIKQETSNIEEVSQVKDLRTTSSVAGQKDSLDSREEFHKQETSILEGITQVSDDRLIPSVEQQQNFPSTEIIVLDTTEEIDEQKSQKPDSSFQESFSQETSNVKKVTINEVKRSKPNDLGFKKPDSSLLDYKKVAMRLSATAVERLKQFRMETSIPYEILVDVTIRNWDLLPEEIKNSYLEEAQQLRGERLMAGQQKTMETIQRKYSVNYSTN